MKQYNILENIGQYYLAKGLPDSGVIFDPSRREEFTDQERLLDYLKEKTTKKKIKINLEVSGPEDLEDKIKRINPKSIFSRVHFERKSDTKYQIQQQKPI